MFELKVNFAKSRNINLSMIKVTLWSFNKSTMSI